MFNAKETRNQLPLFAYPLAVSYVGANVEDERIERILRYGEFQSINPWEFHGFKYESIEDSSIAACIKRDRASREEIASYLLWKSSNFSFNLPITVDRTPEARTSTSAQLWTTDDSKEAHEMGVNPEHVDIEQGLDIAVFDYVLGQADRHTGNWMINSDKRVTLIDNGYGFRRLNYNAFFVAAFQGRKLEQNHYEFIENVLNLPANFGGLEDIAIDAVKDNAKQLKEIGYIFGSPNQLKDEEFAPESVKWCEGNFPSYIVRKCDCESCDEKREEKREKEWEKRQEELKRNREKRNLEALRISEKRGEVKAITKTENFGCDFCGDPECNIQ